MNETSEIPSKHLFFLTKRKKIKKEGKKSFSVCFFRNSVQICDVLLLIVKSIRLLKYTSNNDLL